MEGRSINTSPRKLKDRFWSLISWKALPAWLVIASEYIWTWFWKLIGWIGNWDTIKDHIGGWHMPVVSFARFPSWLLPLAGIAWLTLIVIFGDQLQFRKKRMKQPLSEQQVIATPAFPENPPTVRPYEYGKDPQQNLFGLFVTNPGYAAFDVTIPPVPIGNSMYVLTFRETLTQLLGKL